jgi:hypothetical protein
MRGFVAWILLTLLWLGIFYVLVTAIGALP